jgi:hypothetical protein
MLGAEIWCIVAIKFSKGFTSLNALRIQMDKASVRIVMDQL